MKLNKQNFSKNYPFLIPFVILIILLILGIMIIWPRMASSIPSQSSEFDDIQIEVIDGNGDLPILSPSKQSEDNFSSIQPGPATIQDLGGGSTQPGSVEELLQDKEIDIKK